MARAIVRAPGGTYPSALTQQSPVSAVDLGLAREQHAGYVRTLRAEGVDVLELPADGLHPDAVFVQDRVCILDGHAVVGRSAVASREGEEAPIVEALAREFPVATLEAPAFLDWGDVLIAEQRLFVGLSNRSNEAAVRQLQILLGARWVVSSAPMPAGLLHLLSGCSYLGCGSLLAVSSLTEFGRKHGFTVVPVPPDEEAGANVLVLPAGVIMPADYPGTQARIVQTGRRVVPVPMSEFEKRDGGVTCLSILY